MGINQFLAAVTTMEFTNDHQFSFCNPHDATVISDLSCFPVIPFQQVNERLKNAVISFIYFLMPANIFFYMFYI